MPVQFTDALALLPKASLSDTVFGSRNPFLSGRPRRPEVLGYAGIAPRSSLLRPHAPIRVPLWPSHSRRKPSRTGLGLNGDTHIRPTSAPFTCALSPAPKGPPRRHCVRLPLFLLSRRPRRPEVLGYAGITPRSSLLRPHAPIRVPLGPSRMRRGRVFAGCCQPSCNADLPDVISEKLSVDARPHTPVASMVRVVVSSHRTTAFPLREPGRRATIPLQPLPKGA